MFYFRLLNAGFLSLRVVLLLYTRLIVRRSELEDLAYVEGQVISLTLCVRSVVRIMTRSMYAVVNQKLSWNSEVELTKKACNELAFLSENVDSLDFHFPWEPTMFFTSCGL